MSEITQKLRKGDFNVIRQDWQPDGTVVITFSKRGEGKVHRVHATKARPADRDVIKEETLKHGG